MTWLRWLGFLAFAIATAVIVGTARVNGLLFIQIIGLAFHAWSYPNVRARWNQLAQPPIFIAPDPDPRPSRLDRLDGK